MLFLRIIEKSMSLNDNIHNYQTFETKLSSSSENLIQYFYSTFFQIIVWRFKRSKFLHHSSNCLEL